MRNVRNSKRWYRLQLAVAAASLLSVTKAEATLLFDNASAPLANNFNPSTTPPSTGAAGSVTVGLNDTFEGGGYTLPTGTADIYGFNAYPDNATDFNGAGTGKTLTDIAINIYIWGSVNPTPSTNSAATPAFSNLLSKVSATIDYTANGGTGLPAGYIGTPGGIGTTQYGEFILNTPVALPSTTVGITINFQGSTDNGLTFNSMQGLTSVIPYGLGPVGGTPLFNGFYRNGNTAVDPTTEIDGNFITGLHSFGTSNQSGPMFQLYGDVGAITNDNWKNTEGGVWTDGTQWSRAAPPTPGIPAVFNLSSSGYTVEVGDIEYASNVFVQNDKVSIDLDAQQSELNIGGVLSVGQQSTGSLTLMNSGGINTGFVVPGSVVVGSNGGTGTLKITNGAYLFSNGDTAIGAGSSLAVGALAKFGTDTLTIAGSTNAWTGQLDIGNTGVDIRDGNLATIINQLKTGMNNGTWTGKGIVSSNAAADTSHLTAVGAILNNDGSGHMIYGPGTALGAFDAANGDAVDPTLTSVLLRYTYYGDTNLDGQVDGSDYSRIDNGFLLHLTGWYNGDFNDDGVVNGSDYTLIDNAFNMQGPNLVTNPGAAPVAADVAAFNQRHSGDGMTDMYASPLSDPNVSLTAQVAPTAVPEPASVGVLGIAAASLLSRRSRRTQGR